MGSEERYAPIRLPPFSEAQGHELVERAGYPGSGMAPATSALLGLLALNMRQAALDVRAPAIPWAAGKTLCFNNAGTD